MSSHLKFVELQNIRLVVSDLDAASEFYRDVFGFIEMQSHEKINDPVLTSWFGFGDRPKELDINIRFMFIPEVMTLALMKPEFKDGRHKKWHPFGNTNEITGGFQGYGVAPISFLVEDLDAAYKHILSFAQDPSYDNISISAPPQKLSPIKPHQVSASKNSIIHGNTALLERYRKVWETRENFHFRDPFGIHWVLCSNVV
ncbi:VOC family protein [Flavivirga sp. 57AJ16]|uniref:VOC family protein n=1 Tax=Flavivirga sp. 57AJ16 TaxID=3025307 RepID=UPI00236558B0|nr:VOC family protein [Flavivirga sp. 57AJ16]MDD7887909.1 VOC family protein [Flavivirga sp. 57AJ16]